MKLWIDDVRPAPEGYVWCKSVWEAQSTIRYAETFCKMYPNTANRNSIELIDCDHDLGDFATDGGDGIRLLDWLEETGRNYPIRIHSANAVGVANMRRIIERNGWKEIN